MTATDQPSIRIVDPRAVRVVAISRDGAAAPAPLVLEPAAIPLAPAPGMAGTGVLGGVPGEARLERHDDLHAVLIEPHGTGWARTPVLMLPPEAEPGPSRGVARREMVVNGWRIEIEVESERRASLRERARRGHEESAHRGPTEVRAIIPGRVVALSIVPGDAVVAGQQLLVVEAMKMQNELRAPRDGVVSSVAVGPGRTIEVGDLLLVLQ
jgi:biotin carboxyl carrier protein